MVKPSWQKLITVAAGQFAWCLTLIETPENMINSFDFFFAPYHYADFTFHGIKIRKIYHVVLLQVNLNQLICKIILYKQTSYL